MKKTNPDDMCGNCRFWQREDDGEPRSPIGSCLRYPPRIKDPAAEDDCQTISVPMFENEWCGEHERE